MIRKDGTLFAVGYNGYGGLGIGNNVNQKTFVQVGESDNWWKVASNYYHSLALKKDGRLYAAGGNAYGQLGDGTTTHKNTFVRIMNNTDKEGDDRWVSIDAGHLSSVAIRKDGSVWACGLNDWGQLGVGQPGSNRHNLTRIGDQKNWKIVSMGHWHLAMINQQGELYVCGANNVGQIGIGSSVPAVIWQPVRVGNRLWKAVAAGAQYHTLGIQDDGSLWSWGLGASGKLGLGADRGNRTQPTQIGERTDWVAVSAGLNNSMALRKDGTIWTFGSTPRGEINTLTRVGTDNDWSAISVGWYHFSGLRNVID